MTFPDGTTSITNDQDLIDSRDILARIDFLAGYDDLDEEGQAELDALRALIDEAFLTRQQAADGATFVRESYFVTSAMELADDMHADANLFGGRPTTWPFMHVDWQAAADDLRQDYAEAEFEGVTYLFR